MSLSTTINYTTPAAPGAVRTLVMTDSIGDNFITFASNADEAADRTITVPALGGNVTMGFINLAQTWTANQKYQSGKFYLFDTANDNTVQFVMGGDEASDRVLTFPLMGGARTVPYLERAGQIFTVTQAFSGTSGESIAQGASGTESSLKIGYDASVNAGFIQAVTWGTAYRELRLVQNNLAVYNVGALAFAINSNRNYGASNNAGGVNFGTSAVQVQSWPGDDVGTVTPSTSPADTVQGYAKNWNGAGTAALHIRNEEGHIVRLFKGAALTTALTTVTCSAPGTPDYAIQDLVAATGYGFVTSDEAQSVIKVIANLQVRVNELEARLQASGQIT